MHDLNDIIPPDSGWTLFGARAINNAGQIVVDGAHALLLNPEEDRGAAGSKTNTVPRQDDFFGELLPPCSDHARFVSQTSARPSNDRAGLATFEALQSGIWT